MRRTLCLLALMAAPACTTVGPDYQPPQTEVAEAWLEPADARPVDPDWWRSFDDPQLVALIERAMTDSPDLAEATARLREARANRDAVLGRAAPEVEASGAATENRLSRNGQLPVGEIPGFDPTFSLFDLGFDASWEIDFWGRRVREAEAAEARIGAAEAGRQQALVVLTAEIARSYMDLRAAQADAAAAEARAEAVGELARLTRMRFTAGESSRLEADNASADAEAAAEAVPRAEAQAAAAAYRISALMGEAPRAVVPGLLEREPVPDAPETILIGLRSDLLRRRPDVRLAERELAAASAEIGVATADLFPRFSVTGGIGLQSRSADDLVETDSVRFSVGPSFSWPIFSGGRIRAQIRAADARAEAAAARYEQAVAEALSDSESAINRFLRAKEAAASASASLADRQGALDLTERRYTAGEDNKLALERARAAFTEAESRFAQARAETARAAVAVFKALGGAWQAEAPAGERLSRSAAP